MSSVKGSKELTSEILSRVISQGSFFYTNPDLLGQIVLPEEALIDGKTYHRFMDVFLLPCPVHQLHGPLLADVMRVRACHFDKFVNKDVNRRVILRLAEAAKARRLSEAELLLDFGAGTGYSHQVLKEAGYRCAFEGVDVEPTSVEISKTIGATVETVDAAGPLPYASESVAACISSFVFHFAVPPKGMLTELARVIRHGGILALNVYRSPDDHVNDIVRELTACGFRCTRTEDLTGDLKGNVYITAQRMGLARSMVPANPFMQRSAGKGLRTPPATIVLWDSLHGDIELPGYLERYLRAPEVQRLKDIRLCDIPSVSRPSLGSVSRYEHSVGATHLAAIALRANGLELQAPDSKALLIASLCHDVIIGPYGHSMEYAFSSTGTSYKHADFEAALVRRDYCSHRESPIYAGLLPKLGEYLQSDGLFEAFMSIVGGSHPLSPLISSDALDVDNIDNVFRLAQQGGIDIDRSLPSRLAAVLKYKSGALSVDDEGVSLVQSWMLTRSEVYKWLIFSEQDFGARAVLNRSLEMAISDGALDIQDWVLTDGELLRHLITQNGSKDAKSFAQRFAVQSAFSVLAFFKGKRSADLTKLSTYAGRAELEDKIRAQLRISTLHHLIHDFRRTERLAKAVDGEGRQLSLGYDSDDFYLGIFLMYDGLLGTSERKRVIDSVARHALRASSKRLVEEFLGAPVIECTELFVDNPAREMLPNEDDVRTEELSLFEDI